MVSWLIEGPRGIGVRLIARTFLPAAVLREEGVAILIDEKERDQRNLSWKAGPQDLELQYRGLMRQLEKEALEDSAIHL